MKTTTTHHRDRGLRAAIACPHCGGATRVRSSRLITTLYRQIELHCVDPDCAATFGGEMAITHAIHASRRPNRAVRLRTSPPRHRPSPDNDEQPLRELPPAVNDDDIVGEALG